MKDTRKALAAIAAAFVACAAAHAAAEIRNGAEYALDGLAAEMTARVARGGTVRFLLEEGERRRWEAAYSPNECAVALEHRAGGEGAPCRAAVTISKHASVQTPVLVEFRLADGETPARTLRVVTYTAPGETPDFRYPRNRMFEALLAECRARGITIVDWHLHIRGGMTPQLAAAREGAWIVRTGALENHGREWPL